MDDLLSQEELNALLGTSDSSAAPSGGQTLTDAEKDAVGEIANISMGSSATALSTLVNERVLISTPVVSYANLSDLSQQFDRPCVFIHIAYKEGLNGQNVLILKEDDVKVITSLMMGGDGSITDEELTELHLSAISEAMNQMMGSASTSLSSMLERKVDISPPSASLIDLNDAVSSKDEKYSFLDGDFVMVSFRMEIGDLVDSQIMQLYPFEFAKEIYANFTGSQQEAPAQSAPQPAPQPQQAQTPPPAPQPMPQMQQAPVQQMVPPQQQYQYQQPMYGGMPGPDVNVQPAQFQPFAANINPLMQQENIDLIMDVPLEVTVELGRTNKSIKEILDFSPGTIIELDKLAGEPIDVLVNGKFVAKGEVVVIEESFGIRVTEIIR
ncbi:MAG: flagellar motor switch phosphatase FliY [Clostridiales bacterium]|nr:flagellar motor switch phosphatase FliY [Clostridiales bacterium]